MYQNKRRLAMADRALKTLCVLFLLPVLFLSSCSNETPQQSARIITDFSADFEASYRDMSLGGSISNAGQGRMSISLDSPETLSGLNITCKNSEVVISRESLECSADEAYLPDCGFSSLLREILLGASSGRCALISQNESSLTYSLGTTQGECTLTYDREGNITSAEIEKQKFKINFI